MDAYRGAILITMTGALWLYLAALSNQPLSVTVEGGRYKAESERVRLKVRVERDKENRLLRVALVSDGEVARASDEQLEGEHAALVRWVEWSSVPAGDYLVVAAVQRSSGKHWQASDRLVVLSRF